MSYELLKSLMEVQSESYDTDDMEYFILEFVDRYRKETDVPIEVEYDRGNIYITKGESDCYPCVVAHTDTVHDIIKNRAVFSSNGVMFAMDMNRVEQVGVGGDDKVGIYVALECLKQFENIKVAFFVDEEVGCVGSSYADMSWFRDVGFVLQCDRQGYEDFVTNIYSTELSSGKFRDAVKPLLSVYSKGFCDRGGLTDVYQLVENGLGVSVANISCGYYAPHSDYEYIEIKEVYDTREFVFDCIRVLEGKFWKVPKEDRYSYNNYSKSKNKYNSRYFDYGLEESDLDDDSEDFVQGRLSNCTLCGSESVEYDPSDDADWCYNCHAYTFHYPRDYSEPNTFLKNEDDEDYFEDFYEDKGQCFEDYVEESILQDTEEQ